MGGPFILTGIVQLAFSDREPLVHVADMKKGVSMPVSLSEIKPLVRPLSQLVEAIKVPSYNDGKPFVPMVELLKVSNGYESEIEREPWWCGTGYCISYRRCPRGHVFRYSVENNCFTNSGYDSQNQLELFQLLHQWHFDIYGWIEDGCAAPIANFKCDTHEQPWKIPRF